MEQLLASRSVSITELKRSPSTVIEQILVVLRPRKFGAAFQG